MRSQCQSGGERAVITPQHAGREARLSRREREHQQRRREVLTAALNLFARRGFEKTTMADIAAQAEFAVGTLYKLFADKDALYRALILDTVERCAKQLIATLEAPGSELEKLERYIELKAALFTANVPTARLYFTQTTGAALIQTAGLDQAARQRYEDVLVALEAVCAAAIRTHTMLDLPPRMLALGLEGVSNAFLAELIARPDDISAEVLATTTKRIFFERVGLGPRQ